MGAGSSFNGLLVTECNVDVSVRNCKIRIEINVRFSCDCLDS